MNNISFWAVVNSIDENGKQYAHAWRFDSKTNLISQMAKFKTANIIHLCKTKKEACDLAELWNNDYKENKCYMFEDAPLF